MADVTKAIRPEPRSDAVVYRPLSGLAVAAVLVAGLGALIVVILAVAAKLSAKPVLFPSALALPIVGLVLAGLARRHIARSEGTRVGAGLATSALWLSALFGGGYAAYYFATEAAIRQQARTAADTFFQHISAGEIEKAFRMTLPAPQQLTIDENDAEGIRRRFGTELAGFERMEMNRVCRAWRGKIVLDPQGVRGWEVMPTGFQVNTDYRMKTPEGHYYISVDSVGHDDASTGARVWQIISNKSGIRERAVTRLGRIFQEVQYEVNRFLPGWAKSVANSEFDLKDKVFLSGKPIEPVDRRRLIEAQIKTPASLILFPGTAMHPPPPPQITADTERIELIYTIDVRVPAVSELVTSKLRVHARSPELMAELTRLQGDGWTEQPLLQNPGSASELTGYKLAISVQDLDLLPEVVRASPRAVTETLETPTGAKARPK